MFTTRLTRVDVVIGLLVGHVLEIVAYEEHDRVLRPLRVAHLALERRSLRLFSQQFEV